MPILSLPDRVADADDVVLRRLNEGDASVFLAGRYAAALGGPNQVVSASASPSPVRSPTQATYPSGLINTAVGAATAPIAGSSHAPTYSALISSTRSAHGVMSRRPGPRLSSTGRA